MARTKKTVSTATALVPTVEGSSGEALAPLGSADLLMAGIADFKITKDDLIDLLVDEATAAIEAEVVTAQERQNAAQIAASAAAQALRDGEQAHLCSTFDKEIKALRKLFADAERVKVDAEPDTGRASSEVVVQFLGPVLGHKEVQAMHRNCNYRGVVELFEDNQRVHRTLLTKVVMLNHAPVAGDTPELKALDEAYKAAHKALTEASSALAQAQQQVYDLRHSTKKLRTQLIRKVLASNVNGGQVLTNVAGLSAQFVASLKKERETGYALARC